MKRPRWYVIVLSIYLAWNIITPLVRSVTYHGKVIDKETGKPITGAVVAVVWYHSPIIQLERTRSFQAAKETLTADDGSFSLWTWPEFDFNPFMYVRTPPHSIIYKAGYFPVATATAYESGFSPDDEVSKALEKGIVIKLRTLKTTEEARRFVSLGSLSIIDVPHSKISRLVQEVNVHSKTQGISPYPHPIR